MADVPEPEQGGATETQSPDQAAGGWEIAKNGRQFVRLPGVGGYAGILWRKGDSETVDEAMARRRKGGGDKPPKSKAKRTGERKGAAAPTGTPVSRDEMTRRIATMMEDILSFPSVPCGLVGLEWEADHFTVQGQNLAHAIARSSERNPWLRRHLESGLEGEEKAIALITTLTLSGAIAAYLAPPLIKAGVLPAPLAAKRVFGIPIPQREVRQLPPRPAYQEPPVTQAMSNVAQMWAAAEAAASEAPQPVPPGVHDSGDGSQDSRVPQPQHGGIPPAGPAGSLADQV